MIAAYQAFWTHAFDFKGRTVRNAFWFAILDNLIVTLVLTILAMQASVFAALATVYTVATIIPGISLVVRRLRDAGKAWAWIFIGLIPVVGSIWLIILYCQPSFVA
ncbi:MAG: DUF805 domain-containing protein [Synechococcaceae bacterium WB8_1A_041]|nr:DUF805 domain-containing protein [Synechococcaceae bacterium WB6_1A_059]NCY14986.1 DUF805 domain-containing protein [Synechococcaceae bacterium WB8_1A_041]NDA75593.1 DUF805 domain-containing protein [Synechococcaceae bacterium WB8_3_299]NDD21513.1 DUF805 domain-containing protein [Synechococcaceae bacterium WBA_3_309]NDE21839.1 DUF805 domain-containing protein [Synechococcaceae bacterium WB9_3_282]OUE48540.1 MAG: hypothetical protein BTM33_07885 [Synechococcus sp. Lanier]